MTQPQPSPPSQRSCPPLPESWRRSELTDAVDDLDAVCDLLARVVRVEGPRPSGQAAGVVKDLAEDTRSALHTLIRALSR